MRNILIKHHFDDEIIEWEESQYWRGLEGFINLYCYNCENFENRTESFIHTYSTPRKCMMTGKEVWALTDATRCKYYWD